MIEFAYNYMKDNLGIIEDYNNYDIAMENLIIHYPERIPLFDFVYLSLMEEIGIKEIVSFDEHFDNKEKITRIH